MKNCLSSSLNRRPTRKLKSLFFPCHSRNRDGQRAMKRSDELQSSELCGSASVRRLVYIFSLYIRYRKSGNKSKMTQGARKAQPLPISIRGPTRVSRRPGLSVGFGTESRIYCLECYRNMKNLLRRKPARVLFLLRRIWAGTHNYRPAMKGSRHLPDVYLDPLLLLNQISPKNLASQMPRNKHRR
jgi:hypothetical protein